MAGTTPTSNHRLWPDSGQILCHQYEISVTESQTFLFAKCIPTAMSEEKRLFLQPIKGLATKHIASKQALWGTLVAGGRKERLQLCLWNLNICIEKVNAKCWLAEMTLLMCLPLVRASTCFSMFVYICTHFHFAPIGGNLTAQSMGELEAEFKFQRRSCKLSFLFPPNRQSAPESLLAGY